MTESVIQRTTYFTLWNMTNFVLLYSLRPEKWSAWKRVQTEFYIRYFSKAFKRTRGSSFLGYGQQYKLLFVSFCGSLLDERSRSRQQLVPDEKTMVYEAGLVKLKKHYCYDANSIFIKLFYAFQDYVSFSSSYYILEESIMNVAHLDVSVAIVQKWQETEE